MPLPYSADLRGRVLLAHEHGDGNAAALAARFRVAVKTPLRTAEPRSIDAAEEQIGPALDTITPQDAKDWFRHCGYSTSN